MKQYFFSKSAWIRKQYFPKINKFNLIWVKKNPTKEELNLFSYVNKHEGKNKICIIMFSFSKVGKRREPDLPLISWFNFSVGLQLEMLNTNIMLTL